MSQHGRWGCTFGLTDDEVCALVHLELPTVLRPMLIAEALHFLALGTGQPRHTYGTAAQHRAHVLLQRHL